MFKTRMAPIKIADRSEFASGRVTIALPDAKAQKEMPHERMSVSKRHAVAKMPLSELMASNNNYRERGTRRARTV